MPSSSSTVALKSTLSDATPEGEARLSAKKRRLLNRAYFSYILCPDVVGVVRFIPAEGGWQWHHERRDGRKLTQPSEPYRDRSAAELAMRLSYASAAYGTEASR